MPDWVDAAFEDYWRRLRGTWKLELIELPLARPPRGGGGAHAAQG